jgi:rhodanese-related sulfurtransferase
MLNITLDDFAAAHAALIPMGQLPDRLAEIDRSKPVFVVCQSGGRSASMTDVLLHHGFDAHSVTGGTEAWARTGRPGLTGAPEGE